MTGKGPQALSHLEDVLSSVVTTLLTWLPRNSRPLPWRTYRDPYAVWVSEVMLQQTRAETVAPYYERWMQRFPDVQSLAAAPLEAVLKEWEGLGYYGRARSLHRAAQQLVAENDGRLPRTRRQLMALPGVGPYTAGAILSLAYGLPEVALDANAIRVLCRLCDIEGSIAGAATRELLWHIAGYLLAQAPPGQAGQFNEALMELGAVVCRPKSPDCGACPLAVKCLANQRGVQAQRPVTPNRRRIPHYPAVAGVIQDGEGQLLVIQRHAKGLLGGLWGFPGGLARGVDSLEASLMEAVTELVGIEIAVNESVVTFRHTYTHFSITLHAYLCAVRRGAPRPLRCAAVRWGDPLELDRYPFAVTDRKIVLALNNSTARKGLSVPEQQASAEVRQGSSKTRAPR